MNCSFCGKPIDTGTGIIYVQKEGTVYNFCSRKCEKNQVNLKRSNRKVRWTTQYQKLKMTRTKKKTKKE